MDYELNFQEKNNSNFMYWKFTYRQWIIIQESGCSESVNVSKKMK